MEGMHVLGTLSGCEEASLTDIQGVMSGTRNIIDGAGLARVGEAQHLFPNGAYTFVICLAESHIAVHTWTEQRVVTLDVFVCNMTKDQSKAARTVFDRVARLFSPEDVRVQEVMR